MPNRYTHIYIFTLADLHEKIAVADAKQVLDLKDIEKLDSIKSKSREQEFIYGRYVCKKLLATYTGSQARQLSFEYDSRGKPFINNQNIPIKFNLSHSGNFLALVIADSEVGIDIEVTNDSIHTDLKTIATEHFMPHEAEAVINALGEASSRALFYKYWTCKEAVLKAIGVGLYKPMKEVDCNILLNNEAIELANKDAAYTIKAWYKFYKPEMFHLSVAKSGEFGDTSFYNKIQALNILMKQ